MPQWALLCVNCYNRAGSLLSACLETIVAIDRSVVLWYKWDLRWCATLCANSVMHFPRFCSASAVSFSCISTSFATSWLIHESFFCVELLLTSGEYELSSTILTNQRFVLVHGIFYPLNIVFTLYIISADLVFAPTLADWKLRSKFYLPHYNFSQKWIRRNHILF